MLQAVGCRIDLLPLKPWVNQTVICPQPFPAMREKVTKNVYHAALPLEHPIILLQLQSMLSTSKSTSPFIIHLNPPPSLVDVVVPEPTLFPVRIDVPIETDGEDESARKFRTPLDLMLLINGCGPDDMSTDLRAMTQPLITKEFWPQLAKSPPSDHLLFDIFVDRHTLDEFYTNQNFLASVNVHWGLLHSRISTRTVIITHNPA